MGQQRDHGFDDQGQPRGPGHTARAGFGPQGEHPSTRPARTPPQFRPEAPPREDGSRFAPQQDAGPGFTPAYEQPGRAPYLPPAPGGDPWEASAGGSWQPAPSPYAPPRQAYQQPWQPYYQPPAYGRQYQAPGPRRKPRVFLWVFLGIQVLFLILVIVQVAAHPAGPTAAQQAAQQCAGNGWYPLFKSQADCDQHFAVALNDAGNVGKGIGVVVIIVIWIVVDFFVGLGYGIYRLASRR
jgi:hypothetical protein